MRRFRLIFSLVFFPNLALTGLIGVPMDPAVPMVFVTAVAVAMFDQLEDLHREVRPMK